MKQSFKNYEVPLKSGDESNHTEVVVEPEVEIKVESDNEEEREASKAFTNSVPVHISRESTEQSENSDQDDSISEKEFKVGIHSSGGYL